VVSDYEQHASAHAWLDECLNGTIRVGIPWVSLLAFLRISTNPRIFPNPLSMKAAWKRTATWLDASRVWCPEPAERHRAVLERFLCGVAGSPKLVADAHLAALAIEHGLVLCSTDGDFARFDGLRWQNPIAAAS